MKLTQLIIDTRKALVVFGSIESTAVALGVLNQTQGAVITSILGAATTVLVYFVRNGRKPVASVAVTKKTVEIRVDGQPVVSLPKVVPNPNPPEETS